MFLGRHGVATGKVIKALRHAVSESTEAAMWSANPLGMLGDTEFLLELGDHEATREDAVSGLATPLQIWANESVKPIALDYRPVERLRRQSRWAPSFRTCVGVDDCVG